MTEPNFATQVRPITTPCPVQRENAFVAAQISIHRHRRHSAALCDPEGFEFTATSAIV